MTCHTLQYSVTIPCLVPTDCFTTPHFIFVPIHYNFCSRALQSRCVNQNDQVVKPATMYVTCIIQTYEKKMMLVSSKCNQWWKAADMQQAYVLWTTQRHFHNFPATGQTKTRFVIITMIILQGSKRSWVLTFILKTIKSTKLDIGAQKRLQIHAFC